MTTGCLKIAALVTALKRPQSLRKLIARGDSSLIAKSASRECVLIELLALGIEGVMETWAALPSDADLEDAFRRHRERHELVTLRLRECETLAREPCRRNVSETRRGEIIISEIEEMRLAA